LLNTISGFLGAPGGVAGNFESIATYTVTGSSVSSWSLSAIPSTYKHLQLRCFFKTDSATWVPFSVNSDTQGQRATHFLRGNGSAASAGNGLGATNEGNYVILAEPSQWGSAIVDILDYASTNKNKTSRVLSGFDGNGSGNILLSSVLHVTNGTTAVSSVGMDITQYGSGAKFVVGSTFALYGIKG